MNGLGQVYPYLLAYSLAFIAALIDIITLNADEFEVAIRRVLLWWIGFAAAMGLFACLSLLVVLRLDLLKLDPLATAVVVGVALPMVLRSKWFVLRVGADEYAIGLEVLYENVRAFVRRRAERVLFQHRLAVHGRLVTELSLEQLADAATSVVTVSKFMTAETKTERQRWIDSTLADTSSEEHKKHALAQFLIDQGTGEWALASYPSPAPAA